MSVVVGVETERMLKKGRSEDRGCYGMSKRFIAEKLIASHSLRLDPFIVS